MPPGGGVPAGAPGWGGAGPRAPGAPGLAGGGMGASPAPPHASPHGYAPGPSNAPGFAPAPYHPGMAPGYPPADPQVANRPPARTQFFNNMDLESMALQGLRELCDSLTPGRTLETTGDVARLITKLHDTIDVFCRCFIPLRQGYAQFVSSLDLQRARHQRSLNRSRAALALESATDVETITMALLDPRDHTFDAPQAVEGIFADLMLHQIALLDGVMQGVRALLEELSPEHIEAAVAQKGGGTLFGNKYRARWQEFRERFERLSEERQAFALIFGQDFAHVYRQYWQRQKEGEEQGLRTDPPRR